MINSVRKTENFMNDLELPTKVYRFTTRDLVTIAVLSALGGVLSTYVGYLGNMVNRMVGVPFGAGQFMAGLHVFWMVIAFGLVRKTGSATACGLLKGVVEMLMGSTHGAVIVLVSLIQGGIFDGTMLLARNKESRFPNYLGAGLAAASNVFVFQILYLHAVPTAYILIITILAFCSGIIFGGYFGLSTLENLVRGGLMHRSMADDEEYYAAPDKKGKTNWKKGKIHKKAATPEKVLAIAFVLLFAIGAMYYFVDVYNFDAEEDGIRLYGQVNETYTFRLEDYTQNEITINEELQGTVTHVPPQNYTGVPLRIAIENATPRAGSAKVDVIGRDGYLATFSLSDILSTDRIIIISEGENFRLVAGGLDGAYWVRDMVEVHVY